MKKKFSFVVSMILALTMAFSFAACKDDNPTGGGGLPTTQEWSEAGISGSFTAEVVGTLAKSQVTENGDISMKWTGSNEQSLDNTITWLKGQGYDSYGGQSAEKITDGFIKTYTAEKIVGGASAMSASDSGASVVVPMSYTYPSVAATSQESKTMIAESYYITADFSVSGVDFKAGELYLDIYEEEAYAPPTGLVTTWPASDILAVLGTSIPTYTGTSTSYQVSDVSMGYIKNVQIFVYGASETDATAYNALLSQNEFTVNADEVYTKRLGSGDELQVGAYMTQTVDPSNYQTTNALMINAMLEKNSGTYTSWSGLNLSEFSAAGIPAYSGGSSFDIDDVATDGMISVDEYEAMIAQLVPYEHLLDAETKQQLEEAREMVELAAQVRAKVVSVYGTNIAEVEAYETALSTAGFVSGLKNIGDFQYQIEISDDEDKAMISIVKMPIELGEEIVDDGGSGDDDGDNTQSGGDSTQSLNIPNYDWDSFPTNVKMVLTTSQNGTVAQSITIIKIENDWMLQTADLTYCLKYNEGTWTEYVYFENQWTPSGSNYTSLTRSSLNSYLSFTIGVDFDAYVENGTATVLGQACKVLEQNMSNVYKYVYKVNAEGLVMSTSRIVLSTNDDITQEFTTWDTSVTAFEVALPQ